MDQRIHAIFETTDLILPDLTILLMARDEIRKDRIERRDQITQVNLTYEIQRQINAIYHGLANEIVDTSDTTVAEATDLIMSML
jgi:thymidylate kinase